MDSEDLSFETTAPTDLSVSGDESGLRRQRDRRRCISKQLIERKQLLHDIQVQKIELSQKSLVIDNLKAEHIQTTEELEEKLNAALHEKNILQAKLESQLKIQQDESRRRQDLIKRELDTILSRQQQLEATNQRLQEKAGNIRKSFVDTELTEGQYRDLRLKNEEELALKDFFAVKLYEALHPWKTDNHDLASRLKIITGELNRCKIDYNHHVDLLDDEKRLHQDVQLKHQRLTQTLMETQGQVKQGDYKVENYDHVKRERDELESEFLDLKKQHAYLESSHNAVVTERDHLNSEMSSAKQTIGLLEQDKTFYTRQVTDYSSKLAYAEERIIQLNDQLEKAKASREELYEKYIVSRDQYKGEYEVKLQEELEAIRSKTNSEVDRLKTTTREMFERENRNLREAREMSASERDRALSNEKETATKYEQLVQELRHLQISGDNKLSELQNEVKLKSFEAERTQLVYEETVRTMKEAQLELEKKQSKLDILTKEYYTLQTTLERQVTELESTLRDKNIRLETYEKLEQELDDVVMQAADVENEEEAERVLFSYGYGANVPTTSKRRLQQSVHLARRVLALERTNTSLKKDIDREAIKNQQLAQELNNTNTLLDQSQQPYHYLIESLRTRESAISSQKQQIQLLESEVKKLKLEATKLGKGKNQMSSDLEKLLNQKEEMSVLRQVVTNLTEKRRSAKEVKKPRTAASTSPRLPARGVKSVKKVTVEPRVKRYEAEQDENVHHPQPLEIKHDMPPWYDKMRNKSQARKT